MCQLHEAILKDLLLMQFFLYVLTQIKIFIFGHLPAIGMANNSYSQQLLLLMHMLSVITTTGTDFISG